MMNRREFLKSLGAAVASVALPRGMGSPPTEAVPCEAVVGVDNKVSDVWYTTGSHRYWGVDGPCILGWNDQPSCVVTFNLHDDPVQWREIELYGYHQDEDDLHTEYLVNVDWSDQDNWLVSILGRPWRPVLDWEKEWCHPYWTSFPTTDEDRIEALGRYLGYL